jgi:hypothetical protein
VEPSGSAVWYHVVSGQIDIFLLPPTAFNLRQYQEGLRSKINMEQTWFPDFCKDTPPEKVSLTAGQTMYVCSSIGRCRD